MVVWGYEAKQKMEAYKLARIHDYNADLNKRWFVEYYFQSPDTNQYEPFKLWVSSKYKSRSARYIEAKKIQDAINQKLKTGYSPYKENHENKTLIEGLELMVAIKKNTCGKRAEHTYGYVARKLTSWLLLKNYKNLRPPEFTKHLAMMYFDNILLTEGLTNRSYNNNLIGLRTLFNCLVERDYLEYNILCKIKKLPQKQSDIVTYTPDEKTRIAAHLDCINQPLFLAAQMIYYCFLRCSELVRLQFKDIDLQRGIIKIPPSKAKRNYGTLIMPVYLIEYFYKLGYDKQPGHLYIFSNNFKLTPGNKQIAPTRIAGTWKKDVQDALEIKKGIYLLKHTGNGELFERGADARNIQLQNRHGSLEHTQIYAEKFSNAPSLKMHDFFREFAAN